MKKILHLIVLSIICFIHSNMRAQISITFTNIVQPCSNDGSATAVVTGGTSPYTYYWYEQPYGVDTISTTNSITGVSKGYYYLTVTDFNNIDTTLYLHLPGVVYFNPDSLYGDGIFHGVKGYVICPAKLASVTCHIIGSNPPYTYSLIPGGTQTISSTSCTFNNVALGSYMCVITNSIGCSDTVPLVIEPSPGYYVNTPTTPDTCTSNGTATAIPTGGGTAPFTYLWNTSPVQTTQTITGLSATINLNTQTNVTVTDSNGCVAMGYAYVQNVTTPYSMQSVASVQYAVCGQSGGSISISNSGGSPPYSYMWSNGATTPSISGLSSGTYEVTVSDAGACIAKFTKYIYSYSPVYVSDSITKVNCVNIGGAIKTYVGGGLAPYTYLWSTGETTSTISNLSSGWYGVTVRDSNGCPNGFWSYVDYQPNCVAIINGQVINDMNGNCVYDFNESGLPQQIVKVNGLMDYSDWNGNYSIRLVNPSGTSTISQTTINPWNQICPSSSINLTPVGGNTYNGNDFYNQPVPITNDLEVFITTDSCRPGFTFNQWVTIFNRGTSTMSGYATLQLDSLFTIISPGNATSYNPSANIFTYNFNNLAPMTWTSFHVNLQAPINTALFTPLTSYAIAYPLIAEATPSNNYDTLNYRVTGSYDPNEKSVEPKGIGATGNITTADETLTYTVHFQNTGSYQTSFVSIIDTIDSNLDIYSLKVTGSFPGTNKYELPIISFVSNDVVKFSFNYCYLQPAATDIANSSGFITYTIKQKNNLSVGTQIKNTAAIYFDYNSPIITNTTLNTITAPIGVEEMTSSNSVVKVYPNPSNGTVVINYTFKQGDEAAIKIYDVTGRLVEEHELNSNKNELQLSSNLNNGIYLYQIIVNDKVVKSDKLVIVSQP